MKRRAILIFNDGGPSNYLPGVKIDKANYINFLKTPEGGAWENDEITVYDNNCNKDLLLYYINNYRLIEQTGYWLIIFSGHGYVNGNGQTILELSPGNECAVDEIKNATHNARCLLISDSCRSVIHTITDSMKLERKLFSDMSANNTYRQRCKDLYLNQLQKVYPDSFCVAYAASFNQCATDDDTTGGYYSSELLRAASTIIEGRKASYQTNDFVASFGKIHMKAKQAVIAKSIGTQVPNSEGYWINTIPFVVVPRK